MGDAYKETVVALSWDLREGAEENHRELCSAVHVTGGNRTGHFPNTSQKH
jgi:hypothetical protein